MSKAKSAMAVSRVSESRILAMYTKQGTVGRVGRYRNNYIHKQSLPLAVPAATQSNVGWNFATAGTAVIPSPPNCASCSPLAEYMSTKRFILPMQNRWTPSCGNCCHCARNLWMDLSASVISRYVGDGNVHSHPSSCLIVMRHYH